MSPPVRRRSIPRYPLAWVFLLGVLTEEARQQERPVAGGSKTCRACSAQVPQVPGTDRDGMKDSGMCARAGQTVSRPYLP